MIFSTHLAATIALGLSLLPSIYALTYGFPYGSQKVRGVNLGGWLVLEVRLSADHILLCMIGEIYLALDYAIPFRCYGERRHRRRMDLWRAHGSG